MASHSSHKYPFIKDLIRDVSVNQVLKGLLSQHLTLWLLKAVCCAEKGSLLLAGSDAGKDWPIDVHKIVNQTVSFLSLN